MSDPDTVALRERATPNLAAIRERAAKATPGPWRTDAQDQAWVADLLDVAYDDAPEPFWLDGPDFIALEENGNWFHERDAEFIAHARTDIPALLGALDEARADRERLRQLVARAYEALIGTDAPVADEARLEAHLTLLDDLMDTDAALRDTTP